jgi:soluble lytic murein transglycosylase-like protein
MRSYPVLIGILLLLATAQSRAARQERPDPEFRQALKAAIESSDSFRDRFDATVWMTDMAKRLSKRASHIPTGERMQLLTAIHREATRFGLDPHLVLALIDVESDFDRFAVSRSGAKGLMQVMPFWVQEIGRPGDNLFDIETNLRYGCAILKIYLERENGNLERALARYNGSLGSSVYPRKVFSELRNRWFSR